MPPSSRPLNLNRAIRALMRDLSTRSPEFSHLVPARVLVVAGEARRASRGSVKPLAFARARSRDHSGVRKPVVRVDGRRMLYCVTLRPLFFRDSRPAQRIETLLHELYHVSPVFDGTLDPARRHARLGRKFSRRFRPLEPGEDAHRPVVSERREHLRRTVAQVPADERPPATHARGRSRRVYTEEQLYTVTVQMLTRAKHRAPPMDDGR